MIHALGKETKSLFKIAGDLRNIVQPNALDFRIERVFKFTTNTFKLCCDDSKIHRNQEEVFPDEFGFFNLTSGAYGILTNVDCKIAKGEAGILIPRSSLNRNGIFLKSGMYDSGFGNIAGCTLYVTPQCCFKVQRGSRIGQFLLFKSETLNKYNGSYNRK